MESFYIVMTLVGLLLTTAIIFRIKSLIKFYKIYKAEKTIESKIDFSKNIVRLGLYLIAFAMFIYYLFIAFTVRL